MTIKLNLIKMRKNHKNIKGKCMFSITFLNKFPVPLQLTSVCYPFKVPYKVFASPGL